MRGFPSGSVVENPPANSREAGDVRDFPSGSAGKESACNAGDMVLIPGLGRSPGGGNGNPGQYSCWDDLMDRGALGPRVGGIAELDMTE